MSMLADLEGDIVSRLQEISYLATGTDGTARGVSDIQTALNLSHVPPPAVIVEYAGEETAPGRPGPLHLAGQTDSAQHYMRTQWDLFCIAQSFGGRYDEQGGRADDSDTGEKGVMTLLDDVFAKLAGYRLPSVNTKTFWGGAKRYSIQDGVLIYVCRIWADVVRAS